MEVFTTGESVSDPFDGAPFAIKDLFEVAALLVFVTTC